MTAIYKTGQEAKAGDSVAGQIKDAPMRGRVIRIDEKKAVCLVERRAPYVEGKPLGVLHDEVEAGSLTLVYRPQKGPLAPTPAPPPAVKAAKAKAAKG